MIQEFWYNIRWLGVWKRKRAIFISRWGFGRSMRAGCMLQLSRAEIFHGCSKHLCCLEFEFYCQFLFIQIVNFSLKTSALATTSPRSSVISTSLKNSVTNIDVQALSHDPVLGVHWWRWASICLEEWEAELMNSSVYTGLGLAILGLTLLIPFIKIALEKKVLDNRNRQ